VLASIVGIGSPRRHRFRHRNALATTVAPSIVSYLLEPIAGGTRLTVHQSGIPTSDQREGNRNGWRTSFDRLAEILSRLGD
jgi:Activator of Hsp90 ATPase homolog 1-like protein